MRKRQLSAKPWPKLYRTFMTGPMINCRSILPVSLLSERIAKRSTLHPDRQCMQPLSLFQCVQYLPRPVPAASRSCRVGPCVKLFFSHLRDAAWPRTRSLLTARAPSTNAPMHGSHERRMKRRVVVLRHRPRGRWTRRAASSASTRRRARTRLASRRSQGVGAARASPWRIKRVAREKYSR